MLQFACGVRLAVDVGDLLHFQRRFGGERGVEEPTDEEHIVVLGDVGGDAFEFLFARDDLLDLGGERDGQIRNVLAGDVLRDGPADQTRPDPEQGHQRGLHGVRLGAGDGDLGSRVGVEHRVGLTRDGRTDGVDDPERKGAGGFREPERGDGVGGLARLGDQDHELVGFDHRVAVTELGRDLGGRADARDPFEHGGAGKTRVVRGPAGDDPDRAHRFDLFGRQPLGGEIGKIVRDAGKKGLPHGVGFFVNLFVHKVGVPAAHRGGKIPERRLRLALDLVSVGVVDRHGIAGDLRDVAVFEREVAAGVGEDRRHVGGDQVLVFTEPDDQGAVLARRPDLARRVGKQDPERVRTADLFQRFEDARQAVALAGAGIDQERRRLGVGVRLEGVALLFKVEFQFAAVLDDPVVNQHQALVPVGVRVDVGRRAVGRPAGVSDPATGVDVLFVCELVFKARDLARRFDRAERAALLEERDPGGVVPPVLKGVKTAENDCVCFFGTGIADNAAHILSP